MCGGYHKRYFLRLIHSLIQMCIHTRQRASQGLEHRKAILQLLQNGLEVLSPKNEKDSARVKQNLSDLDKRIISLLPLVPENVKEALLLLCEATCVPETAESLAEDPEVGEAIRAALAEHTGGSESAEERRYS